MFGVPWLCVTPAQANTDVLTSSGPVPSRSKHNLDLQGFVVMYMRNHLSHFQAPHVSLRKQLQPHALGFQANPASWDGAASSRARLGAASMTYPRPCISWTNSSRRRGGGTCQVLIYDWIMRFASFYNIGNSIKLRKTQRTGTPRHPTKDQHEETPATSREAETHQETYTRLRSEPSRSDIMPIACL